MSGSIPGNGVFGCAPADGLRAALSGAAPLQVWRVDLRSRAMASNRGSDLVREDRGGDRG